MSVPLSTFRSLILVAALMGAAGPDLALSQTAEGDGELAALLFGEQRVMACENTEGMVAACGSAAHILRVQRDLQAIGLDPGPVDGIAGPSTRSAIRMFLTEAGRTPSDDLTMHDDRLLAILAAYASSSGRELDATAIRELTVALGDRTASAGAMPTDLPSVATVASLGPTPAVPTRVFAGPGQFPPTGFRGYGFVAFKSTAADFDFDRHMMICQAYMNTMQISDVAAAARADQFVTVWPVIDRSAASALNVPVPRNLVADRCKLAIDNYDLGQSARAINVVRASGATLDGIGPYLFGWIPADEFGAEGSLILMVDLSRIEAYDQALALFESWKTRIETDPALMRDGLSVNGLRLTIRDWADQHGNSLLSLLGE